MQEFTQRKSNLPHWEERGATYFITFRTYRLLLSDEERQAVLEACSFWHSKRWLLHAAVVMPDHVHILATPLADDSGEPWSIPTLMHSIKSYSAHQVNKLRARTGPVWLREYFDTLIQSEGDFNKAWKYIEGNPAEAGLAASFYDYPYSWWEGKGTF